MKSFTKNIFALFLLAVGIFNCAISPASAAAVEALNLVKTRSELAAHNDGSLFLKGFYTMVELCPDDAKKYPALQAELSLHEQSAGADAEVIFQDNARYLREKIASEKDYFKNNPVSQMTRDSVICRADSRIVSLAKIYCDIMPSEFERVTWGHNYDAVTGRHLKITDVVTNLPLLAGELVNNLVYLHTQVSGRDETPTGEPPAQYYAKLVADALARPDEVNWTLDYSGITVYFPDAPNGVPVKQPAFVSFAALPDAFNPKYREIPAAYATEIPHDNYFFADLNGDGNIEMLSLNGGYNEEIQGYNTINLTAFPVNHPSCSENILAYYFYPFLVKTADGNKSIYAYCASYEPKLYRFAISADNAISKIGEESAAKYFKETNDGYTLFAVPADAANPKAFPIDK